MRQSIGIDKVQVKMKLDNASLVTKLSDLNKVNGWYVNGTPIEFDGTWYPNGFNFEASKIIDINNGHLTMNIKGNELSSESDLSIIFNPTHFGDGYTAHTNLSRSINLAQDIVHLAGIDIDIKDGNLKRLDIAKDRVLKECPSIYAQMIQTYCSFSRQSMKQGYPDGMLLGNQSNQLGFYNRYKKVNLDGIDNALEDNTARLEYRLFNKGQKTWSSKFNIHTLKDLTDDPDQYQEMYQDGMSKMFTSKMVQDDRVILPPSELHKVLEQYYQEYGRNFQNYFLEDIGINTLIENYTLDTFLEVVSMVSNSPIKVLRHRIKQRLNRSMKMATYINHHKRPSIEYIQEIYNLYAKAS